MLYFAYGSNLCWKQMKQRCPSACFVGVAKLPDHRLTFSHRSNTRRCGAANVEAAVGHDVWGVVYQVSEQDLLEHLDRDEGYRPGREQNAYRRCKCTVFLGGEEGHLRAVWIYIAEPQADVPPPNARYKELIVGGARYWGLPEEYVRVLEGIEVGR